jgi:hypothetical protein
MKPGWMGRALSGTFGGGHRIRVDLQVAVAKLVQLDLGPARFDVPFTGGKRLQAIGVADGMDGERLGQVRGDLLEQQDELLGAQFIDFISERVEFVRRHPFGQLPRFGPDKPVEVQGRLTGSLVEVNADVEVRVKVKVVQDRRNRLGVFQPGPVVCGDGDEIGHGHFPPVL